MTGQPLHVDVLRRTRLASRLATERAAALRTLAAAASSIAAASSETRGAVESIYLTSSDRVRALASLTGIGAAAASLATGAPVYLAAPRLVNNLLGLARVGRRVRATREVSLGISELLWELLA